jgi:hypothetical protein
MQGPSTLTKQFNDLAANGCRVAFGFAVVLFLLLVLRKFLHLDLPPEVFFVPFCLVIACWFGIVLPAFMAVQKMRAFGLVTFTTPLLSTGFCSHEVGTTSPPPRNTPEN